MDIYELSRHAYKRALDYLNLEIDGVSVATPYFSNDIGLYFKKALLDIEITPLQFEKLKRKIDSIDIPLTWGSGKATPEEIVKYYHELNRLFENDPNKPTAEGIRNIMRTYLLGIDCSGFVYEVLRYAFEQLNAVDKYNSSLAWPSSDNPKREHAGTFIFDKGASFIIKANDVSSLDLAIRYNSEGKTTHIILFIEDDGKLHATESQVMLQNDGVALYPVTITDSNVIYSEFAVFGKSKEVLYDEGLLSYRRLNILKDKK